MAKDPAFLFYSSDFLTGVADLTLDERGLFITLLCLQHQKGRLSKRMVRLCRGNATDEAVQMVLEKFKVDEDGNYFNERLEVEANKRAAHAEKQRQRAIKGWEKRKKQTLKEESHGEATADAAALPLEDEDENEDVNRNRNRNRNVIKPAKQKKITFDIQMPFDDQDFHEAWECWKAYKKEEHGFKYKSAASEQAALIELSRLGVDKPTCLKIIHQSLANGWKGFFKLKIEKNGRSKDDTISPEDYQTIIDGNY